jgi:hypothetical protein
MKSMKARSFGSRSRPGGQDELGEVGDAHALHGRELHRLRMVEDERPGHVHRRVLHRERPRLQAAGGGEAEVDAVMLRELRGSAGRAALAEVVRRGAEHVADGREPPGLEARVGRLAHAQGAVVGASGEVHELVVQLQLQLHLGMALAEAPELGHQHAQADDGRHRHAQPAPGLREALGDLGLRVAHLGEDAHAALVVERPFLRERHPARRPVEQLHAEPLLQPRHALAHRRGRGAQLPRRLGEVPRLRHADERGHGGEGLHGDGFMTSMSTVSCPESVYRGGEAART